MRKNALKRLAGIAVLAMVCGFVTGCTSVQNYSLRSYQGPLPMDDMVYVNASAYGTPTTPR